MQVQLRGIALASHERVHKLCLLNNKHNDVKISTYFCCLHPNLSCMESVNLHYSSQDANEHSLLEQHDHTPLQRMPASKYTNKLLPAHDSLRTRDLRRRAGSHLVGRAQSLPATTQKGMHEAKMSTDIHATLYRGRNSDIELW